MDKWPDAENQQGKVKNNLFLNNYTANSLYLIVQMNLNGFARVLKGS